MHPVILVLGASGGLGASTLAAVTGTVLGRRAPTLVDLDFGRGGLDATVAVEHLDGLRWGDLADHEGLVDAEGLRGRLPQGPTPVLAARGPRPGDGTVTDVVGGLARVGPVVVDVPSGGPPPEVVAAVADVVVVLVGLRPRWLRDAERLSEGLGGLSHRALVVTRGPRRSSRVAARAAEHLGLPLLEHLVDDTGVLRDEARGRAPRPRGPVGGVARALVDSLPVSDGADAVAPYDGVLGLVS